MDLELTPIYREIEAIRQATPPVYRWQGWFKIGQEIVAIIRLVTIDFVKDYTNNIGDEVVIDVLMGMGTYAKKIYPNKSTLIFQLNILNTQAQTATTLHYKAVPILESMPSIDGTRYEQYTQSELDATNTLQVKFQLLDQVVEKLLLIATGGPFRGATNEAILKTILTKQTKELKINGAAMLQKIEMTPSLNSQARDHVLIAHGTRLVDLPGFMQERCGGIYPTGIGSYVTQQTWWIYPLYNTQQYDRDHRKKLNLYVVPSQSYSHAEKTYRLSGDIIHVMITGDVKLFDDAQTQVQSLGSAFRQSKPSDLFKAGATVQDNKASLKREDLNDEVSIVKKEDGQPHISVSDSAISSNRFKAMSDITQRAGSYVRVVWQNSHPQLLIPGMVCRFFYMRDDQLMQCEGILIYEHSFTQLSGPLVTSEEYQTMTFLTIFAGKSHAT